MRRKNKVSETMEALSKLKDCPEELLKLATTNFEKATVIELIEFNKKLEGSKSELSNKLEGLKKDVQWLKWMIKGLFLLTVIAVIAQVINSFLSSQ